MASISTLDRMALKKSRLVRRTLEVVVVIVSTLSAFLGVAHHIVVFLLEHLYYNTYPKPCQDFFSDLWNFLRYTPRRRSYPLPWNNYILPHPWANCNSQYSQKTGFLTSKICVKKHLTKFVPRGIMEISGARTVSARLILAHLSAFVNRQFAQK